VKGLRTHSAEEQMLAIMLVAGLALAIVALIAFARPDASSSRASVNGPTIEASQHRRVPRDMNRDSRVSSLRPVRPASSAMVTEQLQDLFSSVLSPSDFSTNMATTLQFNTTAGPGGSTTHSMNTARLALPRRVNSRS
jgi:hypothetical protein